MRSEGDLRRVLETVLLLLKYFSALEGALIETIIQKIQENGLGSMLDIVGIFSTSMGHIGRLEM